MRSGRLPKVPFRMDIQLEGLSGNLLWIARPRINLMSDFFIGSSYSDHTSSGLSSDENEAVDSPFLSIVAYSAITMGIGGYV